MRNYVEEVLLREKISNFTLEFLGICFKTHGAEGIANGSETLAALCAFQESDLSNAAFLQNFGDINELNIPEATENSYINFLKDTGLGEIERPKAKTFKVKGDPIVSWGSKVSQPL